MLNTKFTPLLVSFILGASLPFAFAPWSIWILAIISPAAYLLLIESIQRKQLDKSPESNRYLVKISYCYWLGFYVLGASWVYVSIHEYGYTAAPLAGMLALLFAGGLALVNTIQPYIYFRFNLHQYALLTFPASWVLIEWFRSWFLTGFPWLYNGYAFIDSPFSFLASIGGVYLVSFVSIIIASSLFIAIKNRIWPEDLPAYPDKEIASVLIVVTGIAFVAFSGKFWVTDLPEEKISIHLVQGNVDQHDKWLPENQRKILKTYNYLIQEALDISSENMHQKHLIVLPEAAMPTLQSHLSWFFESVDRKAEKNNASVISGIFYDKDGLGFSAEDFYNSIIAVGKGEGLYHKQRLVPFGEYVPLEDFIRGTIPLFDLPYSSFTRGNEDQQGLSAFNFKIAPFICYEILYPQLVFRNTKDADILLTISNDAWFGNSSGPEQHFQMARMRALESGKYLIRTTNTGTTAVVDPRGKVQKILEKNQRAILHSEVYKTSGQTPFSKWGHKPVLYFCLLIFCALLAYTTFQDRVGDKEQISTDD